MATPLSTIGRSASDVTARVAPLVGRLDRDSVGVNFGPEQQQTGGPQVRMIRVGGGDGAAPPR